MNAPDHEPLQCAAIDVGSHSIKLTIAGRSPAGWHPRLERVTITGLGRGEPRRLGLDPDARRLTLATLAYLATIIADHGVTSVAAAGTAVLRNAADAPAFVAEVRERTGLPLEVIAGDEEARLTYLGAVASLPAVGGQVAFDIGGASTELAWGGGLVPDDRRSLDVGTIALTEKFGLDHAATGDQIAAAGAFLDGELAALPDVPAPDRLVGIGATPATLLALHLGRDIADGAEIHGQPISRAVITTQIDRLRRRDVPERRELAGLHPGRAGVVLAGAAITAAVARRWPRAALILSGSGLRAGLMRDRFGDGRGPRVATDGRLA